MSGIEPSSSASYIRNVSSVTLPIGEGAKALSDRTSWYSGLKFSVGSSYVGPVSRRKCGSTRRSALTASSRLLFCSSPSNDQRYFRLEAGVNILNCGLAGFQYPVGRMNTFLG